MFNDYKHSSPDQTRVGSVSVNASINFGNTNSINISKAKNISEIQDIKEDLSSSDKAYDDKESDDYQY